MGALPCEKCHYDIGALPMRLPSSRSTQGKQRQALEMHCPICGTRQPDLLKDRGYFWREREEKYRYWVERDHAPDDAKGKNYSVPIGNRLELQFDKPAEPLGTMEICHAAVPCFVDGELLQVPTLPVREEYLDCLDGEALQKARDRNPKEPWVFGQLKRIDGKLMYVSEVPFRNARSRWGSLKPLPLVPAAQQAGGVPVFSGAFVRHWPNLQNIQWRYHLVSFGVEPVATSLLKEWTWKVHALVPRLQDDERSEVEDAPMRVVAIDPIKPGARISTANCAAPAATQTRDGNRPAWVSVAVDGARGRGGGVFALPRARWSPPQAPPLVFGLDFGTTNTVLATDGEQGKVVTVKPEESEEESTTRWVFGRGVVDDPLDLWPGGAWLGPHKDLLPSELLATRTWGDITNSPMDIAKMSLGVQLGIPLRLWSNGNAPPDSSSAHLLGDFKWERAIRERDRGAFSNLAEKISLVQSRFIEAAVLMATAWRLCRKDRKDGKEAPYPNQVVVKFSYPPAFTSTDLKALCEAAAAAGERLKAHFGLPDLSTTQHAVELQLGVDEAQAAVIGPQPNRMFTVFIDIGGGSLEVLIEDSRARDGNSGHDGMQPEVISNSVYFGGGVYLRALVKGAKNCVRSDYTSLSARVRSFPSGKALIRAQNLFMDGRIDVARKRAAVYGEAVADYVARLLAGVCLEHGRQHVGERGGEPTLNLSRNRLFLLEGGRWRLGEQDGRRRRVRFTLMLLGNGWNTVELPLPDGMGATLEGQFAAQVRERLWQILDAEKDLARQIGDGERTLADLDIDVDCPEIVGTGPHQVLHRKAVVARNVFENPAKNVKDVATDKMGDTTRGVLGMELTINGRVVPWHRMWGRPHTLKPGASKGAEEAETRTHAQGTPQTSGASQAPTARLPTAQDRPPPRTPRWYLGDADPPSGPHAAPALIDRALEGRDATAARRMEVWRSGAEWMPIEQVPELMEELARRAPKRAWHVAEGTNDAGPFTAAEAVRCALRAGKGDATLAGRVEVWAQGITKGWVALNEVAELEAELRNQVASSRSSGPPPRNVARTAGSDGPPPRHAASGPPPRRAPEPTPPQHVQRHWHLDDGQSATGPWSLGELAERACAGRDSVAALSLFAWREGLSAWSPVRDLPELREAIERHTQHGEHLPPMPPNPRREGDTR